MTIPSEEAFAQLLSKPDDVTTAIQKAVREALIDHHRAGQKVPTWREDKIVWVAGDENGEYAE